MTSPVQHIIKKYPNRRLYDSATSAYVTLTDIKKLVMDNVPFAVVDAKTREDLTRSILLQIILEEEAGGSPLLTEAVLANIIRFYGHTMQGVMGVYLEKSVQALTDIQAQWGDRGHGLTPEHWQQFFDAQNKIMQSVTGEYAQQSASVMLRIQEQLQKQAQHMWQAFGVAPAESDPK